MDDPLKYKFLTFDCYGALIDMKRAVEENSIRYKGGSP